MSDEIDQVTTMRLLNLSVDYEIFGNGLGDVRQHMIDPTERMARVCEEFGVPLTVFVELEEFVAFEVHQVELARQLGYNPAELIREQIRSLVARGHDVQLHLHPQWLGAQLTGGVWVLRSDKQTVDSLFGSEAEVVDYIRARKSLLEQLMGSGGRSAKVVAYRAGAFSAQPGRKLIAALAANQICVDSSVVHGMCRRTSAVCLDYRQAPAGRRAWRVREDVAREDRSGPIWEIPIHSLMSRRLFQASTRRFAAKFSRNVPRAKQKELMGELGIRKNPFHFLRFLMQPVPIKLDFHNLSPARLDRWIRSAPAPQPGDPDVLVAIGHSKEHINDADFRHFLRRVCNGGDVKVVSMADIRGMVTPGVGAADLHHAV